MEIQPKDTLVSEDGFRRRDAGCDRDDHGPGALPKRQRGWRLPASLWFPKSLTLKLTAYLIVHAAHAAAMSAARSRSGLFLLRNLGDQAFGGQEQTGDGGRVL